MPARSWCAAALITLAAVACEPKPAPGDAADDARADTGGPPAAAAPAPRAEPAPAWTVSPAGAGLVRVGATLAELRPLLASEPDSAAASGGCSYVRIAGAPEGVWFMVEGGRVVRIEVREGTTPTAEGARIGDPEERVLSLYPSARRQPRKYTAGSYLVAVPDAPGDTLSRYVFETDSQRVTGYRAGVSPPVEYVERCG